MNKRILVALAIFVLAMNLRSTFLSITPLIPTIMSEFQLSGSEVGLLTTIPMLVFAFLSSFMGALGSKFGTGKIMIVSIGIMIVGVFLRYFGGVQGLYIGTFLLAVGIVAGNVLIPALISAFFPDKVPIMTSTYTTLMQVTTGVALASIVPISFRVGWENAILLCSTPIFVAFFLWLPHFNLSIDDYKSNHHRTIEIVIEEDDVEYKPTIKSVFSHKLAWYVSVYMGIQSLTFYSISTWLPVILKDKGLPYEHVGLYLSLFQVTSLVMTFVTPLIMKKLKDQRLISTVLCALYAISFAITYFISSPFMAIVVILGLGVAAGGVFAIAMMFFIIRTSTPNEAAILSGVGQAIGYILASMIPVLIGYLHDMTHGWGLPLSLLIGLCFIFAYTGLVAGQDKKIKDM